MTTESGQATGQSSSSSNGQQQSQASGAQGDASGQGQQSSSQNSGEQQQAAATDRPAYIPEKFWDPTAKAIKADDFAAHLSDLSAFKAEQDIRAQAVPASPDKYEITLPEGFKAPEGMAFEFKADDPALAEARKVAHELKLDQPAFSRLLGIHAAVKFAEQQQITAGRTAELAKLGSAGQARIDAVETWLKAKVGDKANVMIETIKKFPVAANVEALEGIIRAFSAQGGTNFSQSHRENAQDAGKIPGFENMSFAQQRLAQDQARARRTA